MTVTLQNTAFCNQNFSEVFKTLMINRGCDPKHRYVQTAVNALVLEDKRPSDLSDYDVFASVQRRRRVEWYTQDVE
jgi:hypothetical protein